MKKSELVYDCFIFFNEMDLLEIRLNVLDPVVDFFVIVEGTKTFTNIPKPLYFKNNMERYSKFQNKIIHIIIDDYPEYENAWEYEYFQRNAIMRGLTGCKDNDTVIISDVDEIPCAETISQLAGCSKICILKQHFYNFYINMKYENEPYWFGTVVLPYNKLFSPEEVRSFRLASSFYTTSSASKLFYFIKKYFYLLTFNKNKFTKFKKICKINSSDFCIINNGGWHYSYMGGIENIIHKLQSYAHQENNTIENNDPESVKHRIDNGTFSIKKSQDKLIIEPIGENHPRFIKENLDKYINLIYSNS